MAHIGLVCPHIPGHLHPMVGLGRALKRRGHRVTAFMPPDGEARVRAAELEVHLICAEQYPLGAADEILATVGRLSGLAALRYTVEQVGMVMEAGIAAMPDALRASGVDLLLADEVSPGGGSVAELAGTPWVGVSSALCAIFDPDLPPMFTPWLPSPTWWSRARNRLMERFFRVIAGRTFKGLATWRATHGLPPLTPGPMERSPYAHLSQEPEAFAFPRRDPFPQLHNLGPFHDAEGRLEAPFPWEKLDGRPILYASLGTVQNRLLPLFQAIAEAARGLDHQLVLSLGGSAEPEVLGQLPGDPVVVRFAPQLALLERASLCLTHAGMNTTLECLARGVPMVALPLANDQPGVSARLIHSGAGLRVPPRPNPRVIRKALQRVATEPSFRDAAKRMQAHIAAARPRERAADVVEAVLRTGAPVLAGSV